MTSRSRQKSLRQRTRVCKQGAQQNSKVCIQLYAYVFTKVIISYIGGLVTFCCYVSVASNSIMGLARDFALPTEVIVVVGVSGDIL